MHYTIKLIKPLGYCYGVKRAVTIAEKALRQRAGKRIYSLGEIIHNKDAVRDLAKKGLEIITSLNGATKVDVLIISSHGTNPVILEEAKQRGITVIDATCPNVITSQRLCDRLRRENYFIVIVGDRCHREIEALKNFAGANSIVVEQAAEVRAKKLRGGKIGVVVQTTQSKENFQNVIRDIIHTDYRELKICNTICNDTSLRQKAALQLAGHVDTMLVIGGKHSANTRRLFELCKHSIKNCHHIQNETELRPFYLKHSKTVGLVSGASTPDWVIENVIRKIQKISKATTRTAKQAHTRRNKSRAYAQCSFKKGVVA